MATKMSDKSMGSPKPRNNKDQNPEKWKYPPMYYNSDDDTEQFRMGDVESLESGDPFMDQDAREVPEDSLDNYEAPESRLKKLRKQGAPKA